MSESSRPESTAKADDGQHKGSRAGVARLFDVRLVIGGLLTIYGVILTVMGITDGNAAVQKAAGLRINLWTGIGLLVVGLFFLAWIKLAPLQAVRPEDDDTDDDQQPADERR
jgi:xanthine/uracil/vitamin C permease (AzgA family)